MDKKMDLEKFNPKEAELRKKSTDYTALVKKGVKGVDDKEGLEIVHKARMDLRDTRVTVEKQKKEYTEEARDFVTKVNSKAKELIAIIEPVEKDLKAIEDDIAAQKAKIKQDKIDAENKIIQDRIDAFATWKYYPEHIVVKMMSEEQFNAMLADAKKAYEEKKAAEEKKAEEDRILRITNEAKSKIFAANTLDDINFATDFIKENDLDPKDFEADIDGKKKAIAADEKQAELDKQKEEQDKKQKELDDKQAKIDKDAADAKKAAEDAKKLPETPTPPPAPEVKTAAGTRTDVGTKTAPVDDTKTRYAAFLKKHGVNDANKAEFVIHRVEGSGVILLGKLIDTFNY